MILSSIALGFFDGVHIAHKKIIEKAVDYANKNGLSPIALTFDRSPLEILSPGKIRYITDITQKELLIKEIGAEIEFLTLTQGLLDMSAEEFVKTVLVDKYHIRHAVCGYNYTFGKDGKGNTDLLKRLGEKYGFGTEVCDCVTYNDITASATNIRTLLAEGNVVLAGKLLGRNFTLSAIVSEGKKLGRTLGFPTANTYFSENTAMPMHGVYKTNTILDNKKFPSLTNVGINPTFGGENKRCETYIPNFSGNIYGRKIEIEFIDFIREEKKFDSIDSLRKQIEKDLKEVCI